MRRGEPQCRPGAGVSRREVAVRVYMPPVDDYRAYWERQARILLEPHSTEAQMFYAAVANDWLSDEPVEVTA